MDSSQEVMVSARTNVRTLHGLLPVNKPKGMVSKDVSRWLVRHVGRLKLGHVGTLDPNASGVLPILIGRATKLQDYLLDLPKTYEFEIQFGIETDTLDTEGDIVKKAPFDHLTESGLVEAMDGFRGETEQTPPIYSAVKFKGKPLYDYARSGRMDEVPLETLKRKVTISDLEMLEFQGDRAKFNMTCSRGTYVRSLVKDLAEKVGSCGTLTSLVRTRAAGVNLDQCCDLEAIEAGLGSFESLLVPVENIDLGMPRWQSNCKSWDERLRSGQQILIDSGRYMDGIRDDPKAAMPAAWARPLVLLNEGGAAFGMGSARFDKSGRIAISMKRGLK